jgi:membrane fusion protein, multidrug efflux system
VPERYLTAVLQHQSRRKLSVAASPEKDSTPSTGTLQVVDNAVDPNTGTIRLKAIFDNKDGRLWPGQFLNVVLTLDTQTATILPAEAIQVGQQGSFVYVVKADQSVEPRPVHVGQTISGKVIVEKGVAAGDTVVTDGQSRLFPGAKISTK